MTRQENSKIFSAALTLLIRENKVLLIRRCNTSYRDGYYDLPSGHIEPGEAPTQAALREMTEEIGVTANIADMKHRATVHARFPEYTYCYFFVEVLSWQGVPSIQEKDLADDMQWFDLNALPEKIIPYTKIVLEDYLKEKSTNFFELSYDK